jgi:DNA-3-methyladenine glycosylase I
LEGAQAGLSWLTVLKRREGYRRAFAGFDPQLVARFERERLTKILADPGVIRNRRKVESAVGNAIAFLAVQKEFGSFDAYVWDLAGGSPLVGNWSKAADVPVTTPLASRLSSDLKSRGFRFVGPTICYSYLQAAGLVLDHVADCFRLREIPSLTD